MRFICRFSRSMPLLVQILLQVLRWEEHAGQRLFDAGLDQPGSGLELGRLERGGCFLPAAYHLVEHVAVEVERAALLHRVWEDLLDGAEHTRGLVAGAMRTPEALAP
ncbi:hypothetical protein [Atopobium sp. oral taxon 416]|uniref:hypothetical protein n=1 Tax=Atopobium sp. oral taxon 416 TaxID=712157 RepID=UPI001BACD984|nr:hypothetical protein [Atopobium sp. oral taxon 416]QUC03800.1 hypothetical protein J4859_02250 [Atopobium sp. oral taxon 416]